jgi:hypothetical protein
MKSEPRAREQLQAMSTSIMDQSTLVDTTFSKTVNGCFINRNEILYSFLEAMIYLTRKAF